MNALAHTDVEVNPQAPNVVRAGEFWVRADNVEQDLVVVRDIFEKDRMVKKLDRRQRSVAIWCSDGIRRLDSAD